MSVVRRREAARLMFSRVGDVGLVGSSHVSRVDGSLKRPMSPTNFGRMVVLNPLGRFEVAIVKSFSRILKYSVLEILKRENKASLIKG